MAPKFWNRQIKKIITKIQGIWMQQKPVKCQISAKAGPDLYGFDIF